MSNNAPDYKDNLVFPPQEVKSQDDVKHQDTRSSDVLIEAVEKCEKLEKQLKIAMDCLWRYASIGNWSYFDSHGGECAVWDADDNGCEEACVALNQIKELDK